MTWTTKQLKNSRLLRLALALLFAFCLVGLPQESSAQNANVKVGDATLEEFMAAFAAAFENAHYIQVQQGESTFYTGTEELGTDVDTVRLPYLGFIPGYSGPPLFVATVPVTPDGVSYNNFLADVVNYFGALNPSAASNLLERLVNFVDSDYQNSTNANPLVLSQVSSDIHDIFWQLYDDLPAIVSDVDSLESKFFDVLTEDGGNFANPPDGPVVQVFDWWVGNIVSDMRNQLDSVSNQLDTIIQLGDTSGAITIDPNSWQDLIPALMDALKSLQYPADDESPWKDTSTSLTNSISQGVDSESNLTVRAFATATNGVPETVEAVTNQFGVLTSDINDLLEIFSYRDNHSSQPQSVLTIWTTGSMDMQTSAQGEAVSLGRMQIDFADPRFDIGGRPFWEYLRAACIVTFWAFYIIWFWHFFLNWFHRFSNLLNS